MLHLTDNNNSRSILITGTSSGIGEACALRLANLGYRVFAGVHKETDIEKLKQKDNLQIIPILLDLENSTSLEQAVETVTNVVGENGLRGLINNAGIVLTGPLEFLPDVALEHIFRVNVLGQIKVTQYFLPLLRKGHGQIINIGSILGKITLPFEGAYCATKYALESLTEALRLELAPWHIPVSIVEVGIITTPILVKEQASIQGAIEQLPADGVELYKNSLLTFANSVKKQSSKALPADAVARVVEKILTTPTPKMHYKIGRNTTLMIWLSYLPTYIRDWLLRHELKLLNY